MGSTCSSRGSLARRGRGETRCRGFHAGNRATGTLTRQYPACELRRAGRAHWSPRTSCAGHARQDLADPKHIRSSVPSVAVDREQAAAHVSRLVADRHHCLLERPEHGGKDLGSDEVAAGAFAQLGRIHDDDARERYAVAVRRSRTRAHPTGARSEVSTAWLVARALLQAATGNEPRIARATWLIDDTPGTARPRSPRCAKARKEALSIPWPSRYIPFRIIALSFVAAACFRCIVRCGSGGSAWPSGDQRTPRPRAGSSCAARRCRNPLRPKPPRGSSDRGSGLRRSRRPRDGAPQRPAEARSSSSRGWHRPDARREHRARAAGGGPGTFSARAPAG